MSSKLPETDVAVLGLLTEKPSYGYELEQRVKARGMRSWARMEQSSIYNSLRRLERKGFVYFERKGAEGRLRKIFFPTRLGTQALENQVYEHLSIPVKELTNFDLGLGNIYALERHKAIEALARYRNSLEEGIQFLSSSARRMRTFGIPIAAWLFERPLVEARARSEWVKNFIDELEQSKFPGEESTGNKEK